MEKKIRTTRSESRNVACPRCGANPGSRCFRDSSHEARHELAVAEGATRVDAGAAAEAVVPDDAEAPGR